MTKVIGVRFQNSGKDLFLCTGKAEYYKPEIM